MGSTGTGYAPFKGSKDPLSPNFDWSRVPIVRGGAHHSRESHDKIQRRLGYNPDLSAKKALELLLDSGFSFSNAGSGQGLLIGYDNAQNVAPSYLVGPQKGGLFWEYDSYKPSDYNVSLTHTPSGIVVISLDKLLTLEDRTKSRSKQMGYNFKSYGRRRDMPKNVSYEKVWIAKIPTYDMKTKDIKIVKSRITKSDAKSFMA